MKDITLIISDESTLSLQDYSASLGFQYYMHTHYCRWDNWDAQPYPAEYRYLYHGYNRLDHEDIVTAIHHLWKNLQLGLY